MYEIKQQLKEAIPYKDTFRDDSTGRNQENVPVQEVGS